jgi:hypothetical protein
MPTSGTATDQADRAPGSGAKPRHRHQRLRSAALYFSGALKELLRAIKEELKNGSVLISTTNLPP